MGTLAACLVAGKATLLVVQEAALSSGVARSHKLPSWRPVSGKQPFFVSTWVGRAGIG